MTAWHEIPVIRANIDMRDPKSVIALNPGTVCITFSILLISVVFTIWPEALEHSPIQFEQRGVIHHVWHYALMLGAVLTLVGEFWADRRALVVELVGVSMLTAAIAINLAAMIVAAIELGGGGDHFTGEGSPTSPSGLGMALRGGIVAMYCIRSWVLLYQPLVRVKVTDSSGLGASERPE